MEAQIKSWLNDAVLVESFEKFEVKICGESEKGDGMIGQVIFVTVEGVTKENRPGKLDLVLKVSKDNEIFHKRIGALAFETEMHMYEKVFPAFQELLNRQKVATPFAAHPKCYKCLKLDNREVIVLENLRTLGYELHAKRSCLNVHHSRLVLKEYAKLHALSFALKDQNRKQFDAIAKFSHDAWVDFLSAPSLQRSMKNSRQDVLALLKKRGDMHLYEKFSEISKDGPKKILEIFQTIDEQSVILHGDCWNNNFMFQYQNGDRTTPTAVKILDWQTSSLRSPACDLAMFLCLTSAHSAHMFDQLLKEYYEQLSQYLVRLGSSPSLFTFEDLQRHWKNFIVAAIIFAPSGFSFALADQEKIPEFGDITEEIDVSELMDFPIPETDDFYGRLKPLLEYLTL